MSGGAAGAAGSAGSAGAGATAGGTSSSGGTNGQGGQTSKGGSLGEGGVGGAVHVPAIQYDFETDNDFEWIPVGNQRPTDVLDDVLRATDEAHHGTSSLAMHFDGTHTPLETGATPFYGVFTGDQPVIVGPPPANATVTFWAKSTVAGVRFQIYGQAQPDYAWTPLRTTATLQANKWTQFTVTIPNVELFRFGCLVDASLDLVGIVYIDEVAW